MNVSGSARRPVPSSPEVSERMRKALRRDTAPELALRRELHRRGLRYRVDHPLPGLPRRRADLLFVRARVAVFVDGCFWHGCSEHSVVPKANRQWWIEKIDANRRRDRHTDEHLLELGWWPARVWEHEDLRVAADRIETIVRSRVTERPDPQS
jgi:DNA mismatch endonuclease (patch repair protein)